MCQCEYLTSYNSALFIGKTWAEFLMLRLMMEKNQTTPLLQVIVLTWCAALRLGHFGIIQWRLLSGHWRIDPALISRVFQHESQQWWKSWYLLFVEVWSLSASSQNKTSTQTGSGPVVQEATLEEVQPTLIQAFLIKQSNRTVWLHIVYFIEAEFWMCTFHIVLHVSLTVLTWMSLWFDITNKPAFRFLVWWTVFC